MAGHKAGDPLECFSIPLVLNKDPEVDDKGQPINGPDGTQKFRCGFRIGGGIDQDNTKSPQGYPDKGVYVTYIHEGGPAARCGLQVHDKILQKGTNDCTKCKFGVSVTLGDAQTCPDIGFGPSKVNGHDFTVVTHRKAVEYIQRKPVLNMLVYRKGVPQLPKNDSQQHTQFQAYTDYPMQSY